MSEGTKTVEMCEVSVLGADGNKKKEYIPLGWKEAFEAEFGRGIPPMAVFGNWKTKMEARESAKPTIAYRFEPALKEELYAFLNSKPVSEVEAFIAGMFEVVERDADGKAILDENGKVKPIPEDAIYFTEEGVQLLINYLREKCPRTEGKPLIEKIANGGLLRFELKRNKPDEEEGEKSEEKK